MLIIDCMFFGLVFRFIIYLNEWSVSQEVGGFVGEEIDTFIWSIQMLCM